MRKLNVLVACEESQVVCKAFRSRGHNAYSCDVQCCSGGHPEWHILGDVLNVINPVFDDFGIGFYTMNGDHHFISGKWDLIIAHPPCTFISKAGARHMYPKAGVIDPDRLAKALAAKEFFLKLWSADCPHICIENPTPLKVVGLPPPTQVVQPYYFGEPYSKRTLLWEKRLPLLKPTNILKDYAPYLPSNTGCFSRGCGGSLGAARGSVDRSKTFVGVGDAMASQWIPYLLDCSYEKI